MKNRVASCLCGQLAITCIGEPVRVSVCHCLNCQRRSGSAFAVQARWPHSQVETVGEFQEYARRGESGTLCTFRFCPHCGGSISFINEGLPELTAVPVGAFADPNFPPPEYSVYEERQHRWFTVTGENIEHYD